MSESTAEFVMGDTLASICKALGLTSASCADVVREVRAVAAVRDALYEMATADGAALPVDDATALKRAREAFADSLGVRMGTLYMALGSGRPRVGLEGCERCDRPRATDEDWRTRQPGGGEHLCWAVDSTHCDGDAVDWRARALTAEASSTRRASSRPCIGHSGAADPDDAIALVANALAGCVSGSMVTVDADHLRVLLSMAVRSQA